MNKSNMRVRRSWWAGGAAIAFCLAFTGSWSSPASSGETPIQRIAEAATVPEVLKPEPPSDLSRPSVELTASEHEKLIARKRQIQERSAATTRNNPPSPAGLPPVVGRGSVQVDRTKLPCRQEGVILMPDADR